MEELWLRLIELMRPHAPDVETWLNVGTTEEQLSAAEEAMGVRLPDDVREFYRVHNGQKPDAPYFWQGRDILSLERVVEIWTVWKELLDAGEFDGLDSPEGPTQAEGPVKAEWWNPRWIFLAHNGAGDHHCLDLDPAQGGKVGQIIEHWHDWEVRTCIAPSFSAWFESFVSGCESGEFVWSDAEQSFIKSDEE